MPPAKRSPSTTRSSSAKSASGSTPNDAAKATRAAARTGAKSTANSARRAASSTKTQATSGAKRTASAAGAGTANVTSTARSAANRTRRAAGGSESIASVAEQLARGVVKPRELVMLTRDRIQETLDDAASRGRVTRKDANDLVSELVRRGRSQSDELITELEALLDRGREQLGSATRRAVGEDPVDRIVRGADRARRTVGVGPSFPILGYDDLKATQVQGRIKELSRPELRKILDYERKHANRKSVVGALEKSLNAR